MSNQELSGKFAEAPVRDSANSVAPGQPRVMPTIGAGRFGPFGAAARPPKRRRRPAKLYRIGELVEYSGMSRQTIHNYTTMGLLTESCWTGGGHRLYDEAAFGRLDAITEMRMQRKSLQYIRRHFARLDQQSTPGRSDRPDDD